MRRATASISGLEVQTGDLASGPDSAQGLLRDRSRPARDVQHTLALRHLGRIDHPYRPRGSHRGQEQAVEDLGCGLLAARLLGRVPHGLLLTLQPSAPTMMLLPTQQNKATGGR